MGVIYLIFRATARNQGAYFQTMRRTPLPDSDVFTTAQAVLSQRPSVHEVSGPDELKRAGRMAAWKKKYGKNDDENTHSKQKDIRPPSRMGKHRKPE